MSVFLSYCEEDAEFVHRVFWVPHRMHANPYAYKMFPGPGEFIHEVILREISANADLFDSPTPPLKLELRSPAVPESPSPEEVAALIDSGADISCIPYAVLGRDIINNRLLKLDGRSSIGTVSL